MRYVLALCLLFSLNGCLLAPIIESLREVGATPSDRERLFTKDVKKFNDARFWGNATVALAYTEQNSRPAMRDMLSSKSESERIVESKISSVNFIEDSYKAEAEVRVKYYRIPYYVVEERVENQEWRFSLTDGWRIVAIDGPAA